MATNSAPTSQSESNNDRDAFQGIVTGILDEEQIFDWNKPLVDSELVEVDVIDLSLRCHRTLGVYLPDLVDDPAKAPQRASRITTSEQTPADSDDLSLISPVVPAGIATYEGHRLHVQLLHMTPAQIFDLLKPNIAVARKRPLK